MGFFGGSLAGLKPPEPLTSSGEIQFSATAAPPLFFFFFKNLVLPYRFMYPNCYHI